MTVRIFQNRYPANWLVAVFLAIVALASSGCNEKQSVVGNNLLSDTLQLTSINSSDSLPLIVGSSSFSKHISLSGIGYVFIGQSGTTKSFTLSRLSVPDSVPDITVADIVSVKMFITPSNPYYAFGDTTSNQLSFTVYKVAKLWGTTATLDTITPISDFIDKSKQLAKYDGIIPLKDSTGAISIDFDKELIIEWFALRKQFGKENDSLNYGIAFYPNDNSTVIRRFASGAVGSEDSVQFAELQITYRKPAEDTNKVIRMLSAYDGTYTDSPAPTDKSITIQGVSAIHSQINFDVSAIPKGVAVHLAGLTITMDPTRSISGTAGIDPTIYAEFIDSTSNNLLRQYYGSRLKDASGNYTNEYFFPNLNSALEAMVRRNGTGTITLQTQPANYTDRLDKFVFFDSQASDSTKRPRLTVVYSTRPKF